MRTIKKRENENNEKNQCPTTQQSKSAGDYGEEGRIREEKQ